MRAFTESSTLQIGADYLRARSISPLLMGIFTPGLANQEMEAARLQNFAELEPDGF